MSDFEREVGKFSLQNSGSLSAHSGGLLSGVEVVVQRESANHPGRQSSERSSGGVSASER